ncbi:MAG: septal ring-binding cell division protein DamX [Oleiphilaceae bacterium]|jgi:septal ring-binding cell division protein DamX
MSAEKTSYYPEIESPETENPEQVNIKTSPPESMAIEEPVISGQDDSRIIDLPEQDAKILSARDINSKMGDLETHFDTLTKDFSEAQDDLGATIRSLRSRNAKLDKELEKVDLTSSQSALKQAKLSDALEHRIQAKLDTLAGGLEDANESIVEQSDQLKRLSSAQVGFEEMQNLLEKRADDTDEEFKALTRESYQKIQANKAHIEGLNAQHRDQKTSLVILSEENDALKGQVNYLADKVANVELDTVSLKRYTSKGFKIVTGLGVGVTIALVSAVTWFELNPTAVPEFVKTELSELTLSLSTLDNSVTEMKTETAQQSEVRTQLMGDVARVKAQFAELEATAATVDERDSAQRLALQSQVEKSTAQLGHLTATLASVQMGMDDLKFQVEGPGNKNGMVTKSLVPLNDVGWVAQRNPAHYSIQLVGTYDQGYLVSYVNQNETALSGKLLSFNHSQHVQRDWYNLFYGDFASFTDAQVAMNALPLRLKTNYPWIRSFDSIQKGTVK